jgi:hypothetical protein
LNRATRFSISARGIVRTFRQSSMVCPLSGAFECPAILRPSSGRRQDSTYISTRLTPNLNLTN